MAPVIRALRKRADVVTLCTGQHTELVSSALSWFEIEPQDFILMPTENRSLSLLTSSLFLPLERKLSQHKPDIIVAEGDTTTVLVTAITSFYCRIPFAHVEAGLRTGNLQSPFPEEFNRRVAGQIARWHFCPTKQARSNLLAEGVAPGIVHLTGNTIIDALALTVKSIGAQNSNIKMNDVRKILVTMHRRENLGRGIEEVCHAIKVIHENYSDVLFVLPIHPNPLVGKIIKRSLAELPRVHLSAPLDYPDLVREMTSAHFIMTDSGGIQEEAPFLCKPVLVLRDVTERPEAVELGLARLVGTDRDGILRNARELLDNPSSYARMARGGSPYGDGFASERICEILLSENNATTRDGA